MSCFDGYVVKQAHEMLGSSCYSRSGNKKGVTGCEPMALWRVVLSLPLHALADNAVSIGWITNDEHWWPPWWCRGLTTTYLAAPVGTTYGLIGESGNGHERDFLSGKEKPTHRNGG
jgi:hypothetical protein